MPNIDVDEVKAIVKMVQAYDIQDDLAQTLQTLSELLPEKLSASNIKSITEVLNTKNEDSSTQIEVKMLLKKLAMILSEL